MSEARLRANQMPKVKSRIYDVDFEILKWYTMVVAGEATENQLQSLASQKIWQAYWLCRLSILNKVIILKPKQRWSRRNQAVSH